MPYKSLAQMRYLHATHPALAKRWDAKYGEVGYLAEKITKIRKKKKPRGNNQS